MRIELILQLVFIVGLQARYLMRSILLNPTCDETSFQIRMRFIGWFVSINGLFKGEYFSDQKGQHPQWKPHAESQYAKCRRLK